MLPIQIIIFFDSAIFLIVQYALLNLLLLLELIYKYYYLY
nr:MAG TPA: hypothetical protein [Bacteriophage sp.]